MTLKLNDNDYIEFTLPFSADADRIVDSDGREICQISGLCKPEEAIRLTKLFASSYQALTLLSGIASFIHASTKDLPEFTHGTENENKESCILCSIDEFMKSVFDEPAPQSKIIS
jgi:hypothetical protein